MHLIVVKLFKPSLMTFSTHFLLKNCFPNILPRFLLLFLPFNNLRDILFHTFRGKFQNNFQQKKSRQENRI